VRVDATLPTDAMTPPDVAVRVDATPPVDATPRADAAPRDAEAPRPDMSAPNPDAGSLSPCEALGVDPAAEVCNGVDDDCDGVRDDGVACPAMGERCIDGQCQAPPSLFDVYVRVEPGFFAMGSTREDRNFYDGTDEVQHLVGITRAFAVSPAEVTQAEYARVVEARPSAHLNCDECPVERVTWAEAAAYCNALTARSEVPLIACYSRAGERLDDACTGYRLPTEAEWEYAARAGSETTFSSGPLSAVDCNLDANLDRVGWYCGNSATQNGRETHPVRRREANAWGLFDMHGNVAEWVEDRYAANYGGFGEVTLDPTGSAAGVARVVRGGDYQSPSQDARSAARSNAQPGSRFDSVGFRCVRTLTPAGAP